jgi:cyclopropane fatty-acyl-phospholipid synthase-like methyltransferase
MSDWNNYKAHATRKPREQVVRAAALCTEKEQALDLGAGTLIESVFLLENGFKRVTAVDSSEETRIFAEELDPERFTLKISSYQDFNFKPNHYDLISAQYALPFHGPENFGHFIENIKASLKPRGIFVGQLFGVRDEWNTEDTRFAFQTKEEALDLLKGLELVEFEEEEKEAGKVGGAMKHWHLFHFITRK